MNFIDLFAGGGGLSEGFIRAGFKAIAHVEMDEAACYTLKTRIASRYLKRHHQYEKYVSYLKGDISRKELYKLIPDGELGSVIHRKITPHTIGSIFREIDGLNGSGRVDVIVGGPPCQSYSRAGLAAVGNGIKDDERNYLYRMYARFLKKYKPSLFIFENVPHLYSADGGRYYRNMKKYFQRQGYIVKDKVLDAADFGVLQRRKRVIIIGWRKKFDKLGWGYPTFRKRAGDWKLRDVLDDLPVLTRGDSERWKPYRLSEVNDYLKRHEIRNGLDFVTLNHARPHMNEDLVIYKRAIKTLRKGKRMKYSEVPENQRTQGNIEAFLDRFKVVDQNDSISHTLIAHIAKDGHHYIHPDVAQLRSISVREAARIQSFPDDYFFEGVREGANRTAAFKQIGNAVPPLMAERIAIRIHRMLSNAG